MINKNETIIDTDSTQTFDINQRLKSIEIIK